MAERLQQCPFCGSDTRINSWRKRIGKATPHIVQTHQIKCKKQSCGMSGPLFKVEGGRQLAAEHWNRCSFENARK